MHSDTPPELVFPAQASFSWTLRGARARRVKAEQAARTVSFRISGLARDAAELAAAIAFCKERNARLELH